MKVLWRSIAVMTLACPLLGCGADTSTQGPQQSDPNAAAEEAKRLLGDMKPGPIKQTPAKK